MHCLGRDQQQAVDHAIGSRWKVPREIIVRPACWISWMPLREVAALERSIVNHRKMREDIIGQEEEVAERFDERLAAPGVLPFVEINDHPEHEHRRDDGDDPARDRLGAGARPRAEHGQGQRQRSDQSNADPPGDRRRGEDQEHRRDGQYGAGGGQAVDEDHPQDRDRHEERLLPAVGRQVVDRQRRRRQKDEDPK